MTSTRYVDDLTADGIYRNWCRAVVHCRRLIELDRVPVDAAIDRTLSETDLYPCHWARLGPEIRAFYANRQGDAA